MLTCRDIGNGYPVYYECAPAETYRYHAGNLQPGTGPVKYRFRKILRQAHRTSGNSLPFPVIGTGPDIIPFFLREGCIIRERIRLE